MCKQCLWCWAASGSTLETRKGTRHKPQERGSGTSRKRGEGEDLVQININVSGASEWSDKLIHQVAVGPELITGGVYGEGSVVVIAFRFVVIALVVLATRWVYLRSAHHTRVPATS